MTHAYDIPPLAPLLARAAPAVHPLITRLYDRLLTDKSIGKTRGETRNILNCGATTERQKEKDGILKTYVDGASVRVDTASIYLHAIDLITASNPVDGAPRKARLPPNPYRKGDRRPRTPQELAALQRANERRHREALARREAAA
jgi:hypothetical protein